MKWILQAFAWLAERWGFGRENGPVLLGLAFGLAIQIAIVAAIKWGGNPGFLIGCGMLLFLLGLQVKVKLDELREEHAANKEPSDRLKQWQQGGTAVALPVPTPYTPDEPGAFFRHVELETTLKYTRRQMATDSDAAVREASLKVILAAREAQTVLGEQLFPEMQICKKCKYGVLLREFTQPINTNPPMVPVRCIACSHECTVPAESMYPVIISQTPPI